MQGYLEHSDVMRATGATARQLRHWLVNGLVVPSVAVASGSGSRVRYAAADVEKVQRIKDLVTLGLTVPAIRKVLPLLLTGRAVVVGQARLSVRLEDGLADGTQAPV